MKNLGSFQLYGPKLKNEKLYIENNINQNNCDSTSLPVWSREKTSLDDWSSLFPSNKSEPGIQTYALVFVINFVPAKLIMPAELSR